MNTSLGEFERLVLGAVVQLPENIRKAVKNTAIVVEEGRAGGPLFGLYQGVPENVWGKGESIHLPDKITIFKKPIENQARDQKDLENLVRMVVWHEIAHYLGFNEKETRRLEKKWQNHSKP
jgi:predicted Zn-dependent protease with MMP-like domain